jgi:two-component system alkaline phosphatase synthesis response regulator PhoP
MAKRILLVDDEQDILDLLKYNLEAEGYETLAATEGLQALELAQNPKGGAYPDLIILDVMLPGKDGWEVIRQLRQNSSTRYIPVIFLTAKGGEVDEVVGLELGADDYIVKPISMRKLLARVKTVLRKTGASEMEPAAVLRFGEVEINTLNYSVKVAGKTIPFTKKEFEVLVYLAKRPGRVVTRDTLLSEVWGHDVVVIDRTIDVHIRKIREKLGEKNMHLIETIKGVGYRLKAEE